MSDRLPGTWLARAALVGAILGTLVIGSSPAARASSGAFVETFDAAWQLILDTHFDPAMNGVDWTEVRDELRPRAASAQSAAELRDVLEEMIGRLGQSHFALIPSVTESSEQPGGSGGDVETTEEGDVAAAASCGPELSARVLEVLQSLGDLAPAGPGIEVRTVEGQIVVTGVAEGGSAEAAELGPGSKLVEVNGARIEAIADCLGSGVTSEERHGLAATVVAAFLAGPAGSTVRLEIEDGGGARRQVELERRLPADATAVKFGNLPTLSARLASRWIDRQDRRVALVEFNIWMVPIAPRFEEAVAAMREADGFVLDLRGNPGGVAALAQGIAGYFVDEAASLGTIKARRSELELRINPRRVLSSGERFTPYQGPLAVLVDSGTGSTSEIFAAGLQDLGRARLFGEATAGAALPAQAKRLPNGDVLMHATGDFIRPSGSRIEGEPVVPDEVVPLTRRGLLSGRDEPLEAALDWIVAQTPAHGGPAR